MLKRLFDIVLVCLLLTTLMPLFLGLVLVQLIIFKRPILFTQQRPGLNGKLFTIYKFRTMTDKRDEQGNLLPDDQRLPPFGRFLRSTSLDELPEFFNVLRGDMSLVGPRPLLEEYLPLYNKSQARRHDVKPGITGWAQVNGRNAISWEDKFKLDLWYVENMNFWLDLKILFLTIAKVVSREGVTQPGHETAEKYRGTKNTP